MAGLIPFGRNRNRDLTPSDWVRSMFSDPFFAPFDFALSGQGGMRTDLKDAENEYILEAELPGVPREKISLEAHDGMLTISANDDREIKEDRDGYVYRERRVGTVKRSFSLDGIREDGIKADFKNGVLSIHLPKADPGVTGRRNIEIGD